jgi:GWxTD domain-containing protein
VGLTVHLLRFVILGLCLAGSAPAAELSSAEMDWLELVEHIISPTEREVFLTVPAEERGAFVEAFWKARDPVPSTERNELRIEHERRVRHADQFLGSGGARRGSKSDRGWAYIVLGPPRSILRFSGRREVVSSEVWEYFADGRRGVPPIFRLVFYQPHGFGEYRLYDPGVDGPTALVPGGANRAVNSAGAIAALGRIDPDLARAALSVDAAGPHDLAGGTASGRASADLQRVRTVAERQAPDAYARNWAARETEVRAVPSFEQYEAPCAVRRFRSREGGEFLEYVLEVPPRHLVVEQHEGQYHVTVELYAALLDASGRELGSSAARAELTLGAEQLDRIRTAPLAVSGVVAAAGPVRRLRFVLGQPGPASRAVGRAEVRLDPLPIAPAGSATLSAPLLGYVSPAGRWPVAAALAPIREAQADVQVLAPPQSGLEDGMRLSWLVRAEGSAEPLRTGEEPVPAASGPTAAAQVELGLGLAGVAAGRYELRMQLVRGGQPLAAAETRFEVLPTGAAPAWHLRFDHEPLDHVLHNLRRAEQLENAGQAAAAVSEVQHALAVEPEAPEAVRAFARLLLEQGRARELAAFLERRTARWMLTVGALEPEPIEQLALAASARVLLKDFERAAELYRRAVEAAPGSARLTAALGAVEQARGRLPEAAELYRRALQIDPDQPRLRAVAERLEAQMASGPSRR